MKFSYKVSIKHKRQKFKKDNISGLWLLECLLEVFTLMTLNIYFFTQHFLEFSVLAARIHNFYMACHFNLHQFISHQSILHRFALF